MSLIKTMSLLKTDLADLTNFADKAANKTFKVAALNIISECENDLHEIDNLISRSLYHVALFKIASHVGPRHPGFFLRKNYDYDEGWRTLLDDFRSGKIKGISDKIKKLRRFPKKDVDKTVSVNEKHLDTTSDNPDENKKKLIQRASKNISEIDSYCANNENRKYWRQLRESEEFNQAVEDFINYIEEVKC